MLEETLPVFFGKPWRVKEFPDDAKRDLILNNAGKIVLVMDSMTEGLYVLGTIEAKGIETYELHLLNPQESSLTLRYEHLEELFIEVKR